MPGDRRAGAAEHAAHVNEAAGLLEAGVRRLRRPGVLAGRLGCSAAAGPPLRRPGRGGRAGPGPRARPRCSPSGFRSGWPPRSASMPARPGRTVSSVAAQALEEFLARAHRDRPPGETSWRWRRSTSSAAMPPPKCQWPTGYWCRSGGPGPPRPAAEGGARDGAAIYARVSSARQAKDQTIGSQLPRCASTPRPEPA